MCFVSVAFDAPLPFFVGQTTWLVPGSSPAQVQAAQVLPLRPAMFLRIAVCGRLQRWAAQAHKKFVPSTLPRHRLTQHKEPKEVTVQAV